MAKKIVVGFEGFLLNEDGSIAVPGQVDGRDLAADGTKLDTYPALSGVSTEYMNGQGAFTTPTGSGDVATDAIWDAKGDLAVGTGADTAAKLTAGANGLFLQTASGEATGLQWAAGAGGGDVTVSGTPTDGQAAIWTTATDIEGSSLGFAPAYVAATGAKAGEKVQALANGDTVEDGTADEADWGTAQTKAGAGNLVLLSSGSHYIDNSITLTSHFKGQGEGTIIEIAAGATISMDITGNLTDCLVNVATTHAQSAITVVGEYQFWRRQGLLSNLRIYHKGVGSPSWPAGSIGITLLADNEASQVGYISQCSFGPSSLCFCFTIAV